jgi:hypothetical protein
VGSGKPPIEQPVEQRDILSRGQGVQDSDYDIETVTVLHITGETEIVQSDVMDRKNQLFWGCGYQL